MDALDRAYMLLPMSGPTHSRAWRAAAFHCGDPVVPDHTSGPHTGDAPGPKAAWKPRHAPGGMDPGDPGCGAPPAASRGWRCRLLAARGSAASSVLRGCSRRTTTGSASAVRATSASLEV